MKSVYVIMAAILMAGCARLEFEDRLEHPAAQVTDTANDISLDAGQNGWQIHSLYFLDRETRKVRAKFRKVLNEPRWNYHEIDSVSDYQVLDDAARPFLMQKTYESDDVLKSFTHHGDTIKIYHCGDYPKGFPIYSLLVVTRKDGVNIMMK